MKKILGLLVIMMLVFGLVACGESDIEPVDNDTTDTETDTDESEGTDEAGNEEGSEETANTQNLAVGDTVNFNGLLVTVNSVEYSQGNDFESPSEDVFLVVDVSIENETDESENISSMLMTELVDPEGYSYDITIYTDAQGSLDGEVGPGRTMRGQVAFDVPDHESYEFIFSDPFQSGQAIWQIEKE
ncbi:DUF4352 domain-containing protein [Caldalkalibacillus salinus]|uniref:DUF4352 domain-containing protein n=1 Tax=Caldalkalibacillus salinus TaxID=2803787 RepID=UPI0019215177|nr:DUF4352 domain-containing protein [Caldalkalibacillus salinus]